MLAPDILIVIGTQTYYTDAPKESNEYSNCQTGQFKYYSMFLCTYILGDRKKPLIPKLSELIALNTTYLTTRKMCWNC